MTHLLIDVDGTLINSLPGIASSLFAAQDEMGLARPSEQQLHRLPGPPLEVTFAAWGYNKDTSAELLNRYRAHYFRSGWLETELFPGWEPALQHFRDQGLGLCTATSKGEAIAAQILENLGVAKYFDFIGGAEEDGPRRTKAAVISYVLDTQGLSAQDKLLMIGDREHDTLGAREFGIPTALVGWGHGSRAEWADADYYADDMDSLVGIVDTFHAQN